MAYTKAYRRLREDIVADLGHVATLGFVNYRATFAEALAQIAVGDYFSTAESGSLRLYKRISAAPGYQDQGDLAAPVTADVVSQVRTDLSSTSTGKGSALVGYKSPQTGSVDSTLHKKAQETVSVKDFGAVGDNGTDDTAAATAAVAAALAASATLVWPAGTYLTTASIPNFHSVRHVGQGIVKRGSGLWYIEPRGTQTNILYVATTGNASNDGLSSSQPMATVQNTFDALQGSWLEAMGDGNWRVSLAAGSYAGGATWSKPVTVANPFLVFGPAASFGVPTAIIDGAISGDSGIYFNGGPSNATVRDIKFQNFTAGSVSSGLIFDNGVTGYALNVHTENCIWAGLNCNGSPRAYIEGGLYNNCRYGIRFYSNVTFTTGYNSSGHRTTVTNCTEAGIYAVNQCNGHIDYTDVSGCVTGVSIGNASRVHFVSAAISTCTTGIDMFASSSMYDDVTYPTTYTGNTTNYKYSGYSTDYANRNNLGYYDATGNRVWWGKDWYGGSVNSATSYVWGTDRTGNASFAYMVPDATNAIINMGRTSSTTAAQLTYRHADTTKSWRMSIETAAAYTWTAASFYGGAADNTQDLGLTGTRWRYIHAFNVRTHGVTVASLPVAATAGAGTRAFVTDATATTFASIVAGGGANGVPVYSDGTNWRIG